MSKAYVETMITLTLSRSIFQMFILTFSQPEYFEIYEKLGLRDKAVELHDLMIDLLQKWPKQNDKKIIEKIKEKTDNIIRNNKHLQSSSIHLIPLFTIIIGRLGDLNGYITDPIRKQKLSVILDKTFDLNKIIEDNFTGKDNIEDQFDIGFDIYKDLG